MHIQEKPARAISGWAIIALTLAILIPIAMWVIWLATGGTTADAARLPALVPVVILALITVVILLAGLFHLEPNEAAVFTLFGAYRGTVRAAGLLWTNPLYQKKKISLRLNNFAGETIKVNDLRGNPIEIGAIVVWRVRDTAQATFEVQDYRHYITVQSEAALRHLAMSYPYDTFEDEAHSLRESVDEVSASLKNEIEARLAKAGVHIEEARLSHLAYAPEIAEAMLQRQQADAIVAARSRIVDGAVGMVEMALDKLEGHETLHLDEERKAAMVSNLLVVLCGHEPARPVVNTGTLYT